MLTLRRGHVAVLAAVILGLLLTGCREIGRVGNPIVPAAPACASEPHDGPTQPSASSQPLFAVTTTSAWSSLRVRHPAVVVYQDGTIATLVAPTPGAPDRTDGSSRQRTRPLVGYVGGAIDPCRFERLRAEFTDLRGLDFGETGIMDGTYTGIDVMSADGAVDSSIGADNLRSDSEMLTADQQHARQRLIAWLDELDTFVRAGELPVDRIAVIDGIQGYRSTDTDQALPWTGPRPTFQDHCAMLTGDDARRALSDAAGSSSAEERSAVFYAEFTVDGERNAWALLALAPGFGCTF